MSFTHLHVHSGYSLMNSTMTIEKLVKRASELKFNALALTDEDVLYGVIPFYKACMAFDIKPIIGMTSHIVYDDMSIPLILLAKNNNGYHQLINISTHIATNDKPITLEALTEWSEGLICIVLTEDGPFNELLIKEDTPLIDALIHKVKEVFSQENVFLSLENRGSHVNTLLINQIKYIQNHHELDVVATSDVRYLDQNDVYSYECMLAMKYGESWELTQPEAKNMNRYLCSSEEMVERFSFWPEVIEATESIVARCNVSIELDTLRLPEYPLPDTVTSQSYLLKLCMSKLNERYNHVTSEINERLMHELNIIDSLGFSDYFLIVADFISFAKQNNILVGPGRGSAAGSLVSYVLGITDIDPIKHNLLFERFLNPERATMPDIDIDFSDTRRDEVISYIQEKYGHEHVAQIITFGTFAARSLLRELMKTLTIDQRDQAYILKHIPVQAQKTIVNYVNDSSELKNYLQQSKKLRMLFRIAVKLEGLPRHISTHAAGIVITKEPLTHYIPLTVGANGFYLTQFSMNELASVGLLKIDLLGLKNLTLIERIITMLETKKQIQIDLNTIPENDSKTFKLLQEGKTNGVFQLESDGMKNVLTRLKPTTFEDIVALNALYRPGPMEQIPTYIERKNNKKTFHYLHPDLEPILNETYGVLIYQEQIMQIAHEIAGYSLGKADILRQAVSKKEHHTMVEQEEAFIKGCMNNGYDEYVAKELFSWIVKFADYGFNKSHSVAYSKISYHLSYLKAHYPQVFFSELLSSVINQTEKLVLYMRELNEMSIDVLPPSINHSFGKFTVENGSLRMGLLAIKGVGYQTVQEIVRVRKEKSFSDLFDFCLRTSQSVIQRKVLETLILAGTFDETHENRASLLASIDQALERAELFGSGDGQANLFAGGIDMRPAYIKIDDFNQMKKLTDEKELIGLYISNHPLKQFRTDLALQQYVTINRAKQMNDTTQLNLIAIVHRIKKIRTKRGESMAFVTLSDETEEIESVVFPELFRNVNQWLEEETFIEARCKLSYRDGNKQLIINELSRIDLKELEKNQKGKLFIRFTGEVIHGMAEIEKIVQHHPGQTTILVYHEEKRKTYQLGSHYLIDVNDESLQLLITIFGKKNVILN